MAKKILVIQAQFNELATNSMRQGAIQALKRGGYAEDSIVSVNVPGAWEIPVVAAHAAKSGKYSGIVCIGCVIKGETPHFDFVAGECARALMEISTLTGVPIGFGVLTTDNVEQALVRSGLKGGNKGADAANAVIETIKTLALV
jgi:6,7-dimethyl-8-ribityllumazine synthase